jgi:HAD superfamily hydrolase (TIGR01490 family)
MTVAFFDLDRTLLDCNSGRLWVAHEFREGRIGVRDALWAGWWLARYSLGVGDGLDGAFAAAVASYAGVEEAGVAERTRAWFDEACVGRLRPGAPAVLEMHRERGDRLVLATSSTAYVGLAAQAHWGFDDVLCTRMEVADGLFTGAIAALAYGDAKHTLAAAWAEQEGVDLAECTFYTDSITDRALMEAVGTPVAVHPDRPLRALARERGWTIADWSA